MAYSTDSSKDTIAGGFFGLVLGLGVVYSDRSLNLIASPIVEAIIVFSLIGLGMVGGIWYFRAKNHLS